MYQKLSQIRHFLCFYQKQSIPNKLVKIMAKFNTPVLFQVQSFSQALAQLANEPEFGRVQSIQGLHPMHSSLQE